MRFVVARVENDLVPAVRHVMRGFQADMAAVGIDVSAHGPDFESALAALPGKYVPAENGALFLAVADPAGDAPHGAVVHERDLPEPPPLAAAAGCIALKQLKGEPGVGEVKRMFVPPEFRGHGVARILLGTLLDEARARGYSRLVLSTRDSLVPAIRLYEAHGFRPTPVYDGNPLPDIVCFALDLAPDPEPQLVPLEPRHWDRAVAMMQAAWPAGYKRFGLSTALVRREACEAFLRRAQQDAAHVRAVVAEAGGEVVGINMLWLYDPPVASVGPLGVAPAWQGRGLGRRLLDWAVAEAGPDVSTRLVVATGVVPTYALYCAGGFDAYLQVALLTGVARPAPEDAELVRGVRVRQLAGEADVAACSALHAELLAGEGRAGEIRASLAWADARPRVAEDAASGALLGYTNGFMGDGHAVARSRAALAALLFDHCADGAEAKLRVVQDKRPGLLRWAMARGMRVAMPRTVMATAPPDLSGCWEAGGSTRRRSSGDSRRGIVGIRSFRIVATLQWGGRPTFLQPTHAAAGRLCRRHRARLRARRGRRPDPTVRRRGLLREGVRRALGRHHGRRAGARLARRPPHPRARRRLRAGLRAQGAGAAARRRRAARAPPTGAARRGPRRHAARRRPAGGGAGAQHCGDRGPGGRRRGRAAVGAVRGALPAVRVQPARRLAGDAGGRLGHRVQPRPAVARGRRRRGARAAGGPRRRAVPVPVARVGRRHGDHLGRPHRAAVGAPGRRPALRAGVGGLGAPLAGVARALRAAGRGARLGRGVGGRGRHAGGLVARRRAPGALRGPPRRARLQRRAAPDAAAAGVGRQRLGGAAVVAAAGRGLGGAAGDGAAAVSARRQSAGRRSAGGGRARARARAEGPRGGGRICRRRALPRHRPRRRHRRAAAAHRGARLHHAREPRRGAGARRGRHRHVGRLRVAAAARGRGAPRAVGAAAARRRARHGRVRGPAPRARGRGHQQRRRARVRQWAVEGPPRPRRAHGLPPRRRRRAAHHRRHGRGGRVARRRRGHALPHQRPRAVHGGAAVPAAGARRRAGGAPGRVQRLRDDPGRGRRRARALAAPARHRQHRRHGHARRPAVLGRARRARQRVRVLRGHGRAAAGAARARAVRGHRQAAAVDGRRAPRGLWLPLQGGRRGGRGAPPRVPALRVRRLAAALRGARARGPPAAAGHGALPAAQPAVGLCGAGPAPAGRAVGAGGHAAAAGAGERDAQRRLLGLVGARGGVGAPPLCVRRLQRRHHAGARRLARHAARGRARGDAAGAGGGPNGQRRVPGGLGGRQADGARVAADRALGAAPARRHAARGRARGAARAWHGPPHAVRGVAAGRAARGHGHGERAGGGAVRVGGGRRAAAGHGRGARRQARAVHHARRGLGGAAGLRHHRRQGVAGGRLGLGLGRVADGGGAVRRAPDGRQRHRVPRAGAPGERRRRPGAVLRRGVAGRRRRARGAARGRQRLVHQGRLRARGRAGGHGHGPARESVARPRVAHGGGGGVVGGGRVGVVCVCVWVWSPGPGVGRGRGGGGVAVRVCSGLVFGVWWGCGGCVVVGVCWWGVLVGCAGGPSWWEVVVGRRLTTKRSVTPPTTLGRHRPRIRPRRRPQHLWQHPVLQRVERKVAVARVELDVVAAHAVRAQHVAELAAVDDLVLGRERLRLVQRDGHGRAVLARLAADDARRAQQVPDLRRQHQDEHVLGGVALLQLAVQRVQLARHGVALRRVQVLGAVQEGVHVGAQRAQVLVVDGVLQRLRAHGVGHRLPLVDALREERRVQLHLGAPPELARQPLEAPRRQRDLHLVGQEHLVVRSSSSSRDRPPHHHLRLRQRRVALHHAQPHAPQELHRRVHVLEHARLAALRAQQRLEVEQQPHHGPARHGRGVRHGALAGQLQEGHGGRGGGGQRLAAGHGQPLRRLGAQRVVLLARRRAGHLRAQAAHAAALEAAGVCGRAAHGQRHRGRRGHAAVQRPQHLHHEVGGREAPHGRVLVARRLVERAARAARVEGPARAPVHAQQLVDGQLARRRRVGHQPVEVAQQRRRRQQRGARRVHGLQRVQRRARGLQLQVQLRRGRREQRARPVRHAQAGRHHVDAHRAAHGVHVAPAAHDGLGGQFGVPAAVEVAGGEADGSEALWLVGFDGGVGVGLVWWGGGWVGGCWFGRVEATRAGGDPSKPPAPPSHTHNINPPAALACA